MTRLWSRLSCFVVEQPRKAALIAGLVIIALAWLIGNRLHADLEETRWRQLSYEAERDSIEMMATTQSSSMMGALSMLGLVDAEIKLVAREGRKLGTSPDALTNSSHVLGLLESLGHAYAAEGVFVVAGNGVVGASWDSNGRTSVGIDVKFRPYFQMAMQGKENVYAAVSLVRGDRALYFAVPIYPGNRRDGLPIGVAAGRSDLSLVDELLRRAADDALLLSPQGVVFGSSRKEWIGYVAGELSSERLRAIRDLKQFGTMFEYGRQSVLPFAVEDGVITFEGRRVAVATAHVKWNDPAGDWKLVLVEDLSRSVPIRGRLLVIVLSALVLIVGSALLNALLRGQYQRQLASRQLQAYASQQEAAAARKEVLAAFGIRLQQERTAVALAQVFLSQCHTVLGSLQGAIYMARAINAESAEISESFSLPLGDAQDISLHLLASFACDSKLPTSVLPGQGLLGQCALERRVQVLTTTSTGFVTIRSGLGETAPAAFMIAPIVLKEVLSGVVEVALLTVPDAAMREQFDEMLQLLAMNFEVVGRDASKLATAADIEQLSDNAMHPAPITSEAQS